MNAEELFNVITSNGMREMTFERFKQAVEEHDAEIKQLIDEMILQTNIMEEQNNGLLEYLQMAHQGRLDALTELRAKI